MECYDVDKGYTPLGKHVISTFMQVTNPGCLYTLIRKHIYYAGYEFVFRYNSHIHRKMERGVFSDEAHNIQSRYQAAPIMFTQHDQNGVVYLCHIYVTLNICMIRAMGAVFLSNNYNLGV